MKVLPGYLVALPTGIDVDPEFWLGSFKPYPLHWREKLIGMRQAFPHGYGNGVASSTQKPPPDFLFQATLAVTAAVSHKLLFVVIP